MRNMIKTQAPWVSDVPEGWRSIRNKFLLSGSYSGGTPKSSVDEFYSETGLPFISIADMSSVDYVNNTEKRVTEEGIKDKNLQIVPKGSIIYSMYATVGHVAETKIDATISQAIIALYIKDEYDKEYYKYNLRAVKDYIFGSAEGTTQMNLNAQKVYELYLMQPPIQEQQAIVDFLDTKCTAIDEAIERHKVIIEKLGRHRKDFTIKMVTRGYKNCECKDSAEEWLGMIPVNWSVQRIRTLFKETNERGNDSLPILTVSINTGISDREINEEESERVFVRSEDKTKYKRVIPGDIAYNMMRAWQGAFGAARVEGMVSPAYVTARPIENVDTRYFEYLMRTDIAAEEFRRHSRGITDFRLRLYWDEFRNIKVCIPPIIEQHEIANKLDRLYQKTDEAISRINKIIVKLQEYRKSLIYHAVTGKIDCRGADAS